MDIFYILFQEKRSKFGENSNIKLGLFTKSSQCRHDFAVILLYYMIVPKNVSYISHFSLSFTTHRQKAPTLIGAFCRSKTDAIHSAEFTKSSCGGHGFAVIVLYHRTVLRRQNTSPISPSPLHNTQQKAPATGRGFLLLSCCRLLSLRARAKPFVSPQVHKKFMEKTRFCRKFIVP